MTRIDPPTTAGERETLTAFLDYHRETLAWKCEGLDAEQLARRATPPSTLSLLGLVRHLAEVERAWFRNFAGEQTAPRYFDEDNRDGDFDDVAADDDLVREAFEYWHTEIAHAREIVAAHDLDTTGYQARHGKTFSLRWVLVHLIEEYARHNGHADLLRESIDGETGE